MPRSVRSESSYASARTSRSRIRYIPAEGHELVLTGWRAQVTPTLPGPTISRPATSSEASGSTEPPPPVDSSEAISMVTASENAAAISNAATSFLSEDPQEEDLESEGPEEEPQLSPTEEMRIVLDNLGVTEDDVAALHQQRIRLRNGLEGSRNVPKLLEENQELTKRMEFRKEKLLERRQELEDILCERVGDDESCIDVVQETPARLHQQFFGVPESVRAYGAPGENPDVTSPTQPRTTPSAPTNNVQPNDAAGTSYGQLPPGTPAKGPGKQNQQPPRKDPMNQTPKPQQNPKAPPPHTPQNPPRPDPDVMTPKEHKEEALTDIIYMLLENRQNREESGDGEDRSGGGSGGGGLKMQNFEGKSYEDVEDFLKQWEYFARAKRVPKWMRASQLRSYLGRDVVTRMRSLSNEERDNEGLVTKWLRETYGVDIERYYARKEFGKMVQDYKENARSFMDRLKSKWRIAYDGSEGNWRTHPRAKEAIRDQFFKGLRDRETAKVMEDRMRTLEQEDDEDFLKNLGHRTDSEILHRETQETTTSNQETTANTGTRKKEHVKTIEGTTDANSGEVYEDQIDAAVEFLMSAGNTVCKAIEQREWKPREAGPNDVCFRCQKTGHFSRQCPTDPYVPGEKSNAYQVRNAGRIFGNYGARAPERTPARESFAEKMNEAVEKAIEKKLSQFDCIKELVQSNQAMLSKMTEDKKQAQATKVKVVEES